MGSADGGDPKMDDHHRQARCDGRWQGGFHRLKRAEPQPVHLFLAKSRDFTKRAGRGAAGGPVQRATANEDDS